MPKPQKIRKLRFSKEMRKLIELVASDEKATITFSHAAKDGRLGIAVKIIAGPLKFATTITVWNNDSAHVRALALAKAKEIVQSSIRTSVEA